MFGKKDLLDGEYYSMCYDIPTPQSTFVKESMAKRGFPQEEITAAVKKEIELGRVNSHLRRESLKIGTRINQSVIVFTRERIDDMEKLIKEVKEDYAKLEKRADIYILKYHGDSGQLLKLQAKNSLAQRLNKVLNAMDKLEEKLNQRKIKRITEGMKRQLEKQIESAKDVAKAFALDDEMKQLIQIAESRIEETQ